MSVSGKVIDKKTGQGVENVLVVLFENQNDQPGTRRGFTQTNKDGNYMLRIVPPGEYLILAQPPQNSNHAFDPSPIKVTVLRGKNVINLDFHLETAGGVSGTLYKADGVTPLENVAVTAISENGGMGFTTSNSNGHYEIKNLKEGVYIVGIFSEGTTSNARNDVNVLHGQITEGINIALNPRTNTSIHGLIKSKLSGEILKDAFIILSNERQSGSTRTDSEGRYQISDLSEGSYNLMILKEKFKPLIQADITIKTGVQNRYDFSLENLTVQAQTSAFTKNAIVKIMEPDKINLFFSRAYASEVQRSWSQCLLECSGLLAGGGGPPIPIPEGWGGWFCFILTMPIPLVKIAKELKFLFSTPKLLPAITLTLAIILTLFIATCASDICTCFLCSETCKTCEIPQSIPPDPFEQCFRETTCGAAISLFVDPVVNLFNELDRLFHGIK